MTISKEMIIQSEKVLDLVNEIRTLFCETTSNSDPCDVCRRAPCCCAYYGAFGGEELEDWSIENLQFEKARLTVLRLKQFYAEEANDNLKRGNF